MSSSCELDENGKCKTHTGGPSDLDAINAVGEILERAGLNVGRAGQILVITAMISPPGSLADRLQSILAPVAAAILQADDRLKVLRAAELEKTAVPVAPIVVDNPALS